MPLVPSCIRTPKAHPPQHARSAAHPEGSHHRSDDPSKVRLPPNTTDNNVRFSCYARLTYASCARVAGRHGRRYHGLNDLRFSQGQRIPAAPSSKVSGICTQFIMRTGCMPVFFCTQPCGWDHPAKQLSAGSAAEMGHRRLASALLWGVWASGGVL